MHDDESRAGTRDVRSDELCVCADEEIKVEIKLDLDHLLVISLSMCEKTPMFKAC